MDSLLDQQMSLSSSEKKCNLSYVGMASGSCGYGVEVRGFGRTVTAQFSEQQTGIWFSYMGMMRQ